jgi:hypothetical protein
MDRWLMRVLIGVVALLTASVALVAGAAFFGFALYREMHQHMSSPAAAAATGVAAFAVAALCILAAYAVSALLNRRQAKRRVAPSESMLAMELAGVLGKDVAAFVTARPVETLLISLASGFALGAFPGLRHALGDLLLRRR